MINAFTINESEDLQKENQDMLTYAHLLSNVETFTYLLLT